MPVKIGSFEPLSEEKFTALRQLKTRQTDPAMAALLAEVDAGRPVRVPLVEGQSARELRTAISRAATSRDLSVETVEGEGFVAVKKTDEPCTRNGKPAASAEEQRRRGASQAAGVITPRSCACAGPTGIWSRWPLTSKGLPLSQLCHLRAQ